SRVLLALRRRHPAHPALHSFPTRRSSDLTVVSEPPDRRERPAVTTTGETPTSPPSRAGAGAAAKAAEIARTERPRILLTAVLGRSEEHTSELQSRFDLVCRLLLEKKKRNT